MCQCVPYWWCTKHAQLIMGTWPIYKKHFLQLILTKKNFHLIKYLLATFIFVLSFQSVLVSFCTGMHHEYFFEVANVFSCSPFMFENTENKQLDWRIRHSHLVSTLFHSLVRWWRPRRIRPQITRLSQLENSVMGTWQFTRTLLYQTGSKNGVI